MKTYLGKSTPFSGMMYQAPWVGGFVGDLKE